MRLARGLRTSVGIALAALVLGALVVVTYRNVREVIEAGRWVEHTRDVIGQLDRLRALLKDAESGARAYVLTGLPDSLEPYQAALDEAPPIGDRILSLVRDSRDQAERARALRLHVGEKLDALKEIVAARESGGLEAGARAVAEGRGMREMKAVEDVADGMEAAERSLLTMRTGNFERVARGSLIALAIGAALLFAFLALIGALLRMDLVKRHEAEEQLRLSETELRTTLRSIGDGVIATDAAGRIVLMNSVAEKLTGWPEAEAIGRDVSDVFRVARESTGEPVENPITRVLAERRAAELANHTVLIQRTGERIPIADSGAPIQSDSGELKGAVLVFRDIGERRSAERELQRLAAIVSSSEDAIVGETLDGRITDWNVAAERLFGYSSAEVIGRPIGLLEPPDSEESTGIRLGRIRRGERVQVFDTTRVTKDGERVPVSVSVSPIRDFDGAVVGASKIVRDIRNRKNAELALRASEERFRVLSDAVASLVWACDERGSVTDVNRPWRDFTGQEEGQTSESWTAIVHPDDQPATLAKWQVCVANGEPFEADVRLRRKDGAYRWFAARASRIPSRSGPIWVGTAADVDDLKTAASALRKAKEAAEEAAHAKDRFLAVLSHELRTPLTPALVASQTLERRRDLPEEVRQSAALIRRNVELEALLVDDLLDLTKIERGMVEIRRQSVDIHELVRQVADICRSDLHGRRQTLSVELAAAVHHTDGDPARLQQVFWNLLKNAIKFTPVGGSIFVRSENAEPDRIRVSVKDSGIGIPAGILPRIFHPFERGHQTISPRLSGLGLGLSISRTLIELHGGTIHAESEGEGKGATFSVELAAFVEKSVTPAVRRTGQRRARKLAILLVEDHTDTAGALADLLQQEGHSVTIADSTEAAVEAYQTTKYDLLITDLGLPDGNGHDLLGRLRQIRPVEGIVLSGYGMDADVAKSRAAGFAHHLTKPVQIGKLLSTLADIEPTN
jgi:PAS domain S-box-containing protein